MSVPASSPKGKTKSKTPASHPTYIAMISKAIKELKERGGSSKIAIMKYIMSNYKVGDDTHRVNAQLKMALKRGVKSGALKQTKGTGASGSFRLPDKAAKPKKVKTPKKAGAKKRKSTSKEAAAAVSGGESSADEAPPPEPKKAKSPKKKLMKKKATTKKPKSPKKAKSPKKKTAKKGASKKKST